MNTPQRLLSWLSCLGFVSTWHASIVDAAQTLKRKALLRRGKRKAARGFMPYPRRKALFQPGHVGLPHTCKYALAGGVLVLAIEPALAQVTQFADLAVTKDAPENATVNSAFSYDIVATNNGADTATKVVLFDQLPPGVELVELPPGDDCVLQMGNVVFCDVGELPVNAQYDLVLTVDPIVSGTVTNLVDVFTNSANIPDPNPNNNTDSTTTTVKDPDTDGDAVPDRSDNCPEMANPGQKNTFGDPGVGDACETPTDADSDNDGMLDATDNCPANFNPNQENRDGDDRGDACDTDHDNDGVADQTDTCPTVANPDQADADKDGIGDACNTSTRRLLGRFAMD
jgi:uncharacterized repeat protein (TIGR01451 family)